ncbi:hypothetical protein, partial [Tritonibacter mobilis]|uniref:hypothetical protein n=1 Tax=Tritonibacter mobilis TaxID=379347 RepID=UPI0024E16E3E
PPVKGVLSITSDARNPFFAKLSFFHPKSTKPHVFIEINFCETSPTPLIPHEIPAFSCTNPALSVES